MKDTFNSHGTLLEALQMLDTEGISSVTRKHLHKVFTGMVNSFLCMESLDRESRTALEHGSMHILNQLRHELQVAQDSRDRLLQQWKSLEIKTERLNLQVIQLKSENRSLKWAINNAHQASKSQVVTVEHTPDFSAAADRLKETQP